MSLMVWEHTRFPSAMLTPMQEKRSSKGVRRARVRRPSPKQKERALQVIEALDRAMPEAEIELDYSNEIELLVAVMLSAQCTDAMVNRCTPSLFAAFPTVADYARAEPEDLHPHIARCGLYRSKAKNIVAAMRIIERDYGGKLPRTREELETLPGVGRKTAGVVAVQAFGGHAFPVDTHVGRLARRLGFSKESNPDEIEADMQALLPPETWAKGHQLLVWHGRRTCSARSPKCDRCVVASLCPREGVERPQAKKKAGEGAALTGRKAPKSRATEGRPPRAPDRNRGLARSSQPA